MNKNLTAVLLLATLVSSSGCWFARNTYGPDPLAPIAFAAPPTLEDVIFTVNANTDRVHQLHTDTASLSLDGSVLGLRTRISLERPRRFRLRAKMVSREIDLGSNDERFWFWAKSAPQPAIYYARHDEYANAAAGQLMPIDPTMLIEAFGLVRLEPAAVHEGPYARGDGKVEIRTQLNGAAGQRTRVLVVDDRYGWITEQHLFAANGALLASVRASGHRHYPTVGASLPHQLEISMPSVGRALRIDVGEYWINQLSEDPAQLWVMPQFPGYTRVNVADPHFQPPRDLSVAPAPAIQPPPRASRVGMLPAYRGHNVR